MNPRATAVGIVPSRTRQLTRSAADGRNNEPDVITTSRSADARRPDDGAVLWGLAATPAAAEPGDDTGDEGSNATLAQVLDESTRAWIEAKDKFDASVKNQADLTAKLAATETELARVTEQVSAIAVAAYRTGPLTTFVALMDSGSPTGFAERAGSIDEIAHHNDNLLRDLNKLKKDQAAQKAALEAEVKLQQEQVAVMAAKKKEAEKGLSQAGGPSNGFVSANLPLAQPAPRNASGWLVLGVVQGQGPHQHRRLHHPAHAARDAAGAGGRVQAVRLVLPAERAV